MRGLVNSHLRCIPILHLFYYIVTVVLLSLSRLLDSIYPDAGNDSINTPNERSGTRPPTQPIDGRARPGGVLLSHAAMSTLAFAAKSRG